MVYFSKTPSTLNFSLFENVGARLLQTGELSEYLWIVPTAAKAKDLEKQLVRQQLGKAVGDLPIMTLSGIASKLIACAFPSMRVIDDAESGVFLEQAIREQLSAGSLKYFESRSVGDPNALHALPLPQWTFEMVLNTIRQLKASGIYPHDLQRELTLAHAKNGETTEVLRARDICAIYTAYEAELGDRFTDAYGQFQQLNARYLAGPNRPEEESIKIAEVDFSKAFAGVNKIVLDGFARIERPELELVLTLASIKSIDVTIGIAMCSENADLYSTTLQLVDRLRRVGFSECTLPSGSVFSQDCDPLTSHLCSSLFTSGEKTGEAFDALDRITVFTARTKSEEVESVARAIKHLLDTKPELLEDLSRIAVSSAREYDYTELFRETFRRYNIPVNIADRYRLEGSTLLTAVLALLEVAARGLKRRDVMRAFASPYFVFANARGERLDVANLMRVVTEFKLTGDVDSWHRFLTQRLRDLKARPISVAEEPYEKDRIALKRAEAEKALGDVETLIDMLAPFRKDLRPFEFKQHLHALFSRLRFGDQLLQSSHATIAAGTLELDTRSYRAFIKLLEDLDALFSLMGIQEDALPVSFYLERLRTASLWTRFNPRFKHGHVHVASLEQISGIEFDHVFVVGMTDGVFPSAYEPQVFLMDGMQKGETRHLSEERMLFWNAILSAKKHLYLSYPRQTNSGAELTPSAFISDLKKCCTVAEGLPPSIADSIYSFDELFIRAGEVIRQGSAEILEPSLRVVAMTGSSEVDALLSHTPLVVQAQLARQSKDATEHRGTIAIEMLTTFEKQELAKFTTRVWSISQLERYAACPFSFFAERVLGLDQVSDIEEGLDAREKGTFLHGVLREFLADRRNRGETALQDLSVEELDPIFTEARSIAQRHLGEMNTQHPFWQLDTERLMGLGKKEGILERFIRKEQEGGPHKMRPRYFEASFGGMTGAASESDNELVHPEPVTIGGIKLRGKIDRIDIGEGGFAVVDYKSGSAKKLKHIERGTSLQLPLYLRVAEDLLRSLHFELKGVAALYYKVSESESKRELGLAVKSYMTTHFEKMKGQGLVENEDELNELIDRTIERTKAYVEGMSEGRFGLADKDLIGESCSYCSYYSACRVKEAKDLDVLIEPGR